MKNDEVFILTQIAQTVFDKKGMNILALDIKDISTLTDYILIAEGSVDRHVIAIAKEIIKKLEQFNMKPTHVEGLNTGDWVVLDYNQIMVHLFMPGLREKYRLEELWQKGKIIDLKINLTSFEKSS